MQDDELLSSFDVHTQIATLIKLRLLVKPSAALNLDNCRLRTNVSLEYVTAMGRGLNLEVGQYLFEFVN